MPFIDGDWDDTDAYIYASIERKYQADRRSGPCDDDREESAPYIGMLPEENYREEPSPLNFRNQNRAIDLEIQRVLREGTERHFLVR